MNRAILLPASANLVDEVLEHLHHSGEDYSASIAIFPGKRPAHFLRKAIADRIGKSFTPPVVYSIDAFVDFVFERATGRHPHNLEGLDAAYLLHGIHLEQAERIGGRAFDDFDRFLPLGLKMFAEMEELMMACLSVERIEAELSAVSFRGLHVLARLYRPFYEKIEMLQLSTRATRYRSGGERLDRELLGNPQRIIVAGFFALTSVERKLFTRLESLEQSVLIFQEGRGMEKRLRSLGVEVERRSSRGTLPSVSFSSASDTHGEVFGLTRKIQEAVESAGSPDHKTVIVVPDPDALPAVIHQTIALLSSDNYNISLGYPRKRTPVFGFLQSLFGLFSSIYNDKFFAPDYVRFILHPYTKNILFNTRSDVSRVLFHTLEDMFRDRELPSFFNLSDVESNATLFERASKRGGVQSDKLRDHLVSIHASTIRSVQNAATLGDLAAKTIEVLSYVAAHSTAHWHPLFRPYAESFLETLDRIAGSLPAKEHFSERNAMFRILIAALAEGDVAFPGTPLKGLQVLGFLETRNLKFDRVFILNMNDDALPGSGGRHTLVPTKTRESLGLSTYRDHDEVASYYFDLLLLGAKDVHLFFTEGDKKEPSRFIEQLLWNEQQRTGEKQRERLVATIPYKIVLEHSTPSPIPKSQVALELLGQMAFDSTRLDTYLRCGLRFYHTYVARLEEKEDVGGDVDRRGIGEVVHAALQEFYRPYVGTTLRGADLDPDLLERIVERQFTSEFGDEDIGNKFLLKLQIKQQLRSYIERIEIPRLNAAPATLVSLEEGCSVEFGGRQYRGRMDRIERRGESTFILDYKTGSDKKDNLLIKFEKLKADDRSTWGTSIGSLQLPMYQFLHRVKSGEDPSRIIPAFVLLGRFPLEADIEAPLVEEGAVPPGLLESVENVLFGLVDEILDSTMSFEPAEDLQKNCPTCPFTHLCGTEWVGRRRR